MFVVSKDLVFSPGVEHGELSAVAGDLVKLVCEPAAGSLTAQSLEPVVKRSRDGFRLGFSGQPGNLPGEALCLGVSDIECHDPYV